MIFWLLLYVWLLPGSIVLAQDQSEIHRRFNSLSSLKPALIADSVHVLLPLIKSADDSVKSSYFNIVYKFSERIREPKIRCRLLNDLALYDNNNIKKYLHEVITISEESGLDYELFWAYTSLGYYYKSANLLDSAMFYGLKARTMAASGDEGEKVSVILLVADLYYWARMYDKAELLYKEVLKLRGDSSQYRAWIHATTTNNLGMIELNRKSYNKAREYFKATLKYKEDYPYNEYDSVVVAYTYYLLGKTEYEAGDYKKSREYWSIGSPIADRFGIMEFIFYYSLLNARLLHIESKTDQSYSELFRAYHLLQKKNTNPVGVYESQPQIDADLLTIYDLFINIHSTKGNSDSTLYYYNLHRNLEYKLDMKTAYTAYIQMLAEKDVEIISNTLKKTKEQNRIYLAGLGIVILFMIIMLEYTRRIRIIRKKLFNKQNELLKTNEHLISLGMELQESNRAKDKFFSVLAHDLKNPFSALKGFTELLTESLEMNDVASSRSYADIIRISSDKLYDLLINLLEWSKIHSGRITFSPEKISIESLFSDTVSKHAFQTGYKNISLEVNTEPDAVIYCDKYMMLAIIRNILSNAIRMTPENGKITISYSRNEKNHMISVSDSGPGLSQDQIERIFGNITNKSVPGEYRNADSGLGIIIVKDFLGYHKGKLEVVSEPGQGCNIIIIFPSNLHDN